MQDRLLGEIKKHPITKWWEGHIEISDRPVPIAFCEFSDLESAATIARMIKRRIKSITKKAATDVTPHVYDCVDPPPSVTEVAAQLKLDGINFMSDVGAECFFGGVDKLFGGHSVVVWVDEDGTVGEGHLAG